MKKAVITFYKCIQNSQDLGSNDEHMISSIHFYLDIDGRKEDLYSIAKQTVGSDFNTGVIEISAPVGYNGPFNYTTFRDHAEKYYRGLVGKSNAMIPVSGGGKVHMRNNTFDKIEKLELQIDDKDSSW
jgi:hypothetical protein